MSEQKWLDVEQAAALFGVSPKRLYELTAARQIPFHRIGRRIRFTPGDLAAFEKATAQVPATHSRFIRSA